MLKKFVLLSALFCITSAPLSATKKQRKRIKGSVSQLLSTAMQQYWSSVSPQSRATQPTQHQHVSPERSETPAATAAACLVSAIAIDTQEDSVSPQSRAAQQTQHPQVAPPPSHIPCDTQEDLALHFDATDLLRFSRPGSPTTAAIAVEKADFSEFYDQCFPVATAPEMVTTDATASASRARATDYNNQFFPITPPAATATTLAATAPASATTATPAAAIAATAATATIRDIKILLLPEKINLIRFKPNSKRSAVSQFFMSPDTHDIETVELFVVAGKVQCRQLLLWCENEAYNDEEYIQNLKVFNAHKAFYNKLASGYELASGIKEKIDEFFAKNSHLLVTAVYQQAARDHALL